MDRFTWGVVLGVLGLVAVGVGVAVALRAQPTAPDLATPSGVSLAYAAALQRGDPEQAWELLARSVQRSTTRERFLQRASMMRPSYESARLAAEDERVEGDTARVELVQTYPGGAGPLGLWRPPPSSRHTVRLVREDGAWRISLPPDPSLLSDRG